MRAMLAESKVPSNPRFALATWALSVLIATCGFVIRLWFIQDSIVINPTIADAGQYCNYAWNLLHSHIFSMADPGSERVLSDSFRDPGYPVFLAALMWSFGSGDTWYHAVQMAQAVLGGLTAALTFLVARQWLGSSAAFAAGMAVALWPHSVSIAGYLLSETLFCFMIMLAFWLLAAAWKSQQLWRWALAGLGFGAAAMVNATLTPFALLLGGILWLRQAAPRQLLAVLVAGAAAMPCAWGVRNLAIQTNTEDSAGNRAIANLVQGSWPEYHSAFVASARGDPQAVRVMNQIYGEVELAWHSPEVWFSVAMHRIATNPGHYLAWYAWKPGLLWAWNIRVGVGDIYVAPILHPIFMTNAPLRLFESLCVAVNPLLFLLMLAAAFIVLCRPVAVEASVVLYAAALLVVYETFVYSVLQAEPRYSIPLRPLQMILVATTCHWIWNLWRRYQTRQRRQPIPQKATT